MIKRSSAKLDWLKRGTCSTANFSIFECKVIDVMDDGNWCATVRVTSGYVMSKWVNNEAEGKKVITEWMYVHLEDLARGLKVYSKFPHETRW